MKRVILQVLVVALLVAGSNCRTAKAQYPSYGLRNVAVRPSVIVYGRNAGYSNGYSAGYGYGGYGGYGAGYYGFTPVAPIIPRSAPYGAGYSGGYQPYQDMYLQRLYYGLGF